ncbi:hypothetical protein I3843_13G068100 [Carya illinoinensis]|nr:hypothetical protein I3843_13G068100 [Carya illinoinensis]
MPFPLASQRFDRMPSQEPRGHAWRLWKYVYVQILYVRRSIYGFRSENLDHKVVALSFDWRESRSHDAVLKDFR